MFYDDALPTSGTANSSTNLATGKSVFSNNILYACNSKNNQIKASNATVLATITGTLTPLNVFDNTLYASAIYTDPYKFGADLAPAARAGVPNLIQVAGSVALTGAAFTDTKVTDTFFDKVAYKGAFGTTDWSSGWASYNPQVLPYDKPGAVK